MKPTLVLSALLLVAALSMPGAAAPLALSRDYSALDAAVRALPRSDQNATAASLLALSHDEWEKARALYVWLCENVAYDAQEFYHPGSSTSKSSANSSDAVFASGKAVCAGYSSLYVTLAKAMGLEVVTIAGRAKGSGYQPGDEVPVNHDWNAVKLDGQWHLMDTTWGAGTVNSEAEGFQKRFDPVWFDIPPALAIHWHLPVESRWALLPQVPTYQQFQREVPPKMRVYQALANLGLDLAEVVRLDQQKLPSVWQLTELAKFGFSVDQVVAAAQDGLTDDQSFGLIHLTEGGFSPVQSLEFLQHGLTSQKGRNWAAALQRGFSAQALQLSAAEALPTLYGFGNARMRVLEAPVTKKLIAGVPVRFRLSVPGITRGGVNNGKLKTFEVTDGILDLTLTPQVGPVTVSLEGTNESKLSFWAVLGYEAVDR